MSDRLIDVRTPLAASSNARVELGRDGVLHVLAGPVTLHLDRATCEELTTVLARAMVALAGIQPRLRPPPLALIRSDSSVRHADARALQSVPAETPTAK
jgi:hypothetical protein